MTGERSPYIAMARAACAACKGTGLRAGTRLTCPCIDRAIFRACLAHFRHCEAQAFHLFTSKFERSGSAINKHMFGNLDCEYMADFSLIAKRTLTEVEHHLFRFHFMLGADWKLCARKLGIDKGTFFHSVYRVEHKLGKAFRTTKPYSLFPLDGYFRGSQKGARTTANLTALRDQGQRPVRAPLAVPKTVDRAA